MRSQSHPCPGKLFITLVSGSWLMVWTFFAPVAPGLPFQSGEFGCISSFLLTCLSCSKVVNGSLFPHDCRACSYRQVFVLTIPQPSVQTFVRTRLSLSLSHVRQLSCSFTREPLMPRCTFDQRSRVGDPKDFPRLTKCIFLVNFCTRCQHNCATVKICFDVWRCTFALTASPEVHFTRSDMCQRFNVISCPPPPIGDTNELRVPGSEGLRTRVGALGLPPRPFTAYAQVLAFLLDVASAWFRRWSYLLACTAARSFALTLLDDCLAAPGVDGSTPSQHAALSTQQHTAHSTIHTAPCGGGGGGGQHIIFYRGNGPFFDRDALLSRSSSSTLLWLFPHLADVSEISDRKFH